MLISLCLAYIEDMPENPEHKVEMSYRPTNFNSAIEMFNQHHGAYEELVNFFMERKIEAYIVYDREGKLIEMEFIRGSSNKKIDKVYYEKVEKFLNYLKVNLLLTGESSSDIRFAYESPVDDWGEHYREFYKTKQPRYRVHFYLYDMKDGMSLELLYENIDDRINGQEYSREVKRLRPNWFHALTIMPH